MKVSGHLVDHAPSEAAGRKICISRGEGLSRKLARASSRAILERYTHREFGELAGAVEALPPIGASAGEACPAGEAHADNAMYDEPQRAAPAEFGHAGSERPGNPRGWPCRGRVPRGGRAPVRRLVGHIWSANHYDQGVPRRRLAPGPSEFRVASGVIGGACAAARWSSSLRPVRPVPDGFLARPTADSGAGRTASPGVWGGLCGPGGTAPEGRPPRLGREDRGGVGRPRGPARPGAESGAAACVCPRVRPMVGETATSIRDAVVCAKGSRPGHHRRPRGLASPSPANPGGDRYLSAIPVDSTPRYAHVHPARGLCGRPHRSSPRRDENA